MSLTPTELRAWQQAHCYTTRQMCAALGIHRVTYSRWKHGQQPIAHWAATLLEAEEDATLCLKPRKVNGEKA